jgi:hypothetical protein
MAMSKKEQAYIADLENQLRLAKALRWTEPTDTDVIPASGAGLLKGFLYNAHLGFGGPRVEKACTDFIYHCFGDDTQTRSQGSRRLYSTRLRALKAMRNDVERQAAKTLADIDGQIELEAATDSPKRSDTQADISPNET